MTLILSFISIKIYITIYFHHQHQQIHPFNAIILTDLSEVFLLKKGDVMTISQQGPTISEKVLFPLVMNAYETDKDQFYSQNDF